MAPARGETQIFDLRCPHSTRARRCSPCVRVTVPRPGWLVFSCSVIAACPLETLAGLPGTDGARILAAADRNGGRAEWGLRELIPGRLHAEPAVLLERLLPAIIKLLNELMAATPVEDLSGV